MEAPELAGGKIYTGAPVVPASERRLLADLVGELTRTGRAFRILANVEVGGRQVDTVLALDDGVFLAEAKSTRLPVRGGLNGAWTRLDPSGAWRAYPNAYQQALGAKHALRDAMAAFKAIGGHYPEGRVVFVPSLPAGSDVTAGDFKVAVMTLADCLARAPQSGSPWTLAEWDDFAHHLNLTEVTLQEALASDVRHATRLRDYQQGFLQEYRPAGDRWIAERPEQAAALLDAIDSSAGAYVWGPSGCGKTLSVTWAAARLTERGALVIFLAAKDFAGAWSGLIRREVALISGVSSAELLAAATQVDPDVYLVVDGVNELPVGAHRGFLALARRLNARLIVSGQVATDGHLAGLAAVKVDAPTASLKARIAQRGGQALSAVARDVLAAVGTGIEADIVGQIGAELRGDETRPLLLDQFIRHRLGEHAREGAYGLRRLGDRLFDTLAFSLAEVAFDDAMRAEGVSFRACDAMFETGLLVRRRGRVSFAHEMLLNACAAPGLAEAATADPTGFAARLSTPMLKAIAPDIVATMARPSACAALLAATTEADLLVAAAAGKLGPIARQAADGLLSGTLTACREELASAQLELVSEDERVSVRFRPETLRAWSDAQTAQLNAIGVLTSEVAGLKTYLDLCREVDDRLRDERLRLAEQASALSFPLRSRAFALVYVGFGPSIGFTRIARSDGPSPDREKAKLTGFRPDAQAATSGQLYLVLEWRWSFFDEDTEDCAEFLIEVFRERFQREPYHVQLSALSAVSFTRRVSEATRARLVEAIEGLEVHPQNWAINSSVIDALKWLGALDEQAEDSRADIRAEVAAALAGANGDGELALSLLGRMFDHPFDSIYGEEVTSLEDPLRHRLYRAALAAPSARQSWNLGWLVRQVVALEATSDGPLLAPYAGLPASKNGLPQEEWMAFVLATRFLGRHGLDLPDAQATTAEEACLATVRTLVHAAESDRPQHQAAAGAAWASLGEMPVQLVIGCLSEVDRALQEDVWYADDTAYGRLDLVDAYPVECLDFARRFVDAGLEPQYHHFAPHREIGPALAFGIIARLGSAGDSERLRRAARASAFSTFAIQALRVLDSANAQDRAR